MDDSKNVIPASELQNEASEAELVGEEEGSETLTSKFAHFLRSCWLRRKMVFSFVVIGTLASLLDAFLLPNMYTSATTLMPPDTSSPYSSILGVLSPSSGNSMADLASESLGQYTPGELFISILRSRNVLDGLINRFNLSQYYKTRSMAVTRAMLATDTKIAEDQRSGVITISVTSRSPVLASTLARGYVEELNRVVTENSTSAAHRERVFLEGRVEDIKQKLDESAAKLSQFSTKSGAIDVPSQTRSMVDEGLKLQAELIDGRSQLAALRQTYSEDNVKVRALEAHNAELQRQLDKMGGLPQASGTNTDPNKSPYPTADELPSLGLTYFDLERKVRVDEALWETLTKQYEAARVEEAEEIPTVQVLDAAIVPERKSSPARRFIVALGLMLSLFLACIMVFVRMKWEEMNAEDEPKKSVIEAANATLSSQHRLWRLPGLSWLLRRITGVA